MKSASLSFCAALLSFGCFAPSAWAQTGAVAVARDALVVLDEGHCRAAVPVGVWEVRVAVVIYPDGGWTVALGPFGALGPVPEAAQHAMRDCASRRLALTLAPQLPGPPRAVAVRTRVWRFSTAAEDALRGRLEATRATTHDCIVQAAPTASGVVRLTVSRGADGGAQVTSRGDPSLGRVVARCLRAALGVIPPAETPIAYEVVLAPRTELADPGERADGRAGAVCSWGQYRPDHARLRPPRACHAGLQCCSAGGAAGSDAVCMRVAQCPAYP